MDLSTLNYLNKLLGQEHDLAVSIRETIPFIVTDTGLMVMTVQVRAMVGRVAVIRDMAECRVKSTCFPDAPEEDVQAVFAKLSALAALCSECGDGLKQRQAEMKAKENQLIKVLG